MTRSFDAGDKVKEPFFKLPLHPGGHNPGVSGVLHTTIHQEDGVDGEQAGRLLEATATRDIEATEPRKEQLAKPIVTAALLAKINTTEPAALVLQVEGIKPGADILIARRRLGEHYTTDHKVKLDTDTEQHALTSNGAQRSKYNIVLGEKWLAKNPIEPGEIIEVRQRMPGGKRESKGEVIAVEADVKLHGQHVLNLPEGDRIGAPEGPLALLKPVAHERIMAVDPTKFEHTVENGEIVVTGELAPFSSVILENFGKDDASEPVEVKEDGTFEVRVAGDKLDPFVLHVADRLAPLTRHHRQQGRQLVTPSGGTASNRRLTGLAGAKEDPVVAEIPALGVEGPPEIRLAKFSIAGKRMLAEKGVLPGAVISVMNESDEPIKEYRSVASKAGTFMLDCDLHIDDIVTLTVANPYRSGADDATKIRMKVIESGKSFGFELLEEFGDAARVAKAPKTAVKATANTDSVDSIKPEERSLYFEVAGVEPNTQNVMNILLRSNEHAGGHGSANYKFGTMTVDTEKREMNVSVDRILTGGFVKVGAERPEPFQVVPDGFKSTGRGIPALAGDWTININNEAGDQMATVKGAYSAGGIGGWTFTDFTPNH